MAIRVAFIKNTDITDAHGWVFSRIIYSCSAAYCLGFDAPPAQRIATDFSHAERCMQPAKNPSKIKRPTGPSKRIRKNK